MANENKKKMKEAYKFLDNVKQTLSNQPQSYNKIMKIMAEIIVRHPPPVTHYAERKTNPEVVSKIRDILRGYPDLLEDFEAFLPSSRFFIKISPKNVPPKKKSRPDYEFSPDNRRTIDKHVMKIQSNKFPDRNIYFYDNDIIWH